MNQTSELLFVSLVILLLVLLVLLVLCCILRRSRSRNLTELKISAGRPARILTIRTEPDHAQQLLDRLLDRVFLQVEPAPESGDEFGEEPGGEPGEELEGEHGLDSGSNPEFSTATSRPSRAVSALQNKLWKWITVAIHPPATPPSSPPPPPPATQDQTDDHGPQQSAASQDASLSSQGASCSSWDKGQHDRSKL